MATKTPEQIQHDVALAQQARDQAVQAALARLLAVENIHCEFRKVDTASFNVVSRVMIMPVFAPTLKVATVTMLTGHEVGHALWTPPEGWHGTISKRGMNYKGYLNVLEDVRIERKIKDRYPGLRKDFAIGYQDLAASGFFGNYEEINIGYASMLLVDRINMYCKCGPNVFNFKFTNDEKALLEEAQKADTWEEVLAITDKVVAYDNIIAKKQVEKFNQRDFIGGLKGNHDLPDWNTKSYAEEEEADLDSLRDLDEDFEEDRTSQQTSTNPEPQVDEDEEPSDETEELNPAEEKTEVEDVESEQGDGVSGIGETTTKQKLEDEDDYSTQASEEENPRRGSFTDWKFRSKESLLVDKGVKDYQYINMGILPNLSDCFIGYKKFLPGLIETMYDSIIFKDYYKKVPREKAVEQHEADIVKFMKKFKSKHEGYITNLVRVFELKKNAQQFARARESNTGQLNLNKMHQYKFNDDLFRRVINIPQGKNHGVVMFVDFSGSMKDCIRSVLEQAAVMAMFCRKMNIPYKVMTFTTGYEYLFKKYNLRQNIPIVVKAPEEKGPLYDLLNVRFSYDNVITEIFSDKMTTKEFNQALYMFTSPAGFKVVREFFYMGSTPLDQTIVVLPEFVTKFRKETGADKVTCIILTDGGSTDGLLNLYNSNPSALNLFIKSPWNRKNYNVEPSLGHYRYDGSNITRTLLEMVKDATGVTLLGYHIVTGDGASRAISAYSQYTTKTPEQLRSDFRSDYFMSFERYGYDEYFFIWDKSLSGKLVDGEKSVKDISKTDAKSNTTLATAFTKLKTDKARNRVFATKFMKLIAD